jgi:serine protease Do
MVDRRPIATLALVCVLVAALGLAIYALLHGQSLVGDEREARQAEIAALRARVGALEGRNAALAGRVDSAERTLKKERGSIAPLATRVLRSVFTVETDEAFGTGFVAWQERGASFLVTAHHVVEDAASAFVTVTRKGGSWSGEIVGTDPDNDLAVIRIAGRPARAAPLWQRAGAELPRTGEELLLIGSPFGLEGTVTTGVVSRVTKRYIQTDAAANPGNSGGPALDKTGRIVGVLVSGGGQNVNFAIPIGRACIRLRAC